MTSCPVMLTAPGTGQALPPYGPAFSAALGPSFACSLPACVLTRQPIRSSEGWWLRRGTHSLNPPRPPAKRTLPFWSLPSGPRLMRILSPAADLPASFLPSGLRQKCCSLQLSSSTSVLLMVGPDNSVTGSWAVRHGTVGCTPGSACLHARSSPPSGHSKQKCPGGAWCPSPGEALLSRDPVPWLSFHLVELSMPFPSPAASPKKGTLGVDLFILHLTFPYRCLSEPVIRCL